MHSILNLHLLNITTQMDFHYLLNLVSANNKESLALLEQSLNQYGRLDTDNFLDALTLKADGELSIFEKMLLQPSDHTQPQFVINLLLEVKQTNPANSLYENHVISNLRTEKDLQSLSLANNLAVLELECRLTRYFDKTNHISINKAKEFIYETFQVSRFIDLPLIIFPLMLTYLEIPTAKAIYNDKLSVHDALKVDCVKAGFDKKFALLDKIQSMQDRLEQNYLNTQLNKEARDTASLKKHALGVLAEDIWRCHWVQVDDPVMGLSARIQRWENSAAPSITEVPQYFANNKTLIGACSSTGLWSKSSRQVEQLKLTSKINCFNSSNMPTITGIARG